MSTYLKKVKLIGFGQQYEDKVNLIINAKGKVTEITDVSTPQESQGNKELQQNSYDTLDLDGYCMSPGWIDLHTHIYYGVSSIAVNPDAIGPETGVSVLVDAGSAGEANFLGFREYIIKNRNYPIYAYINIGSIGLILANQVSEFDGLEKIRLDHLITCINNNRKYIKGIKLRASGVILRDWGREIAGLARKVAEETGLPLMVHVGEPLPLLEDILPVLKKGDIVTHCYHGKRWGILEKGKLLPQVKEAEKRGVRFDVGHGNASFNFNVARKALACGFSPFSISTDLHQQNIKGPVYDLPTTMSKMLALGMSLESVIKCTTENPARFLGLEKFEDGLKGKEARFTVFSLVEKNLQVQDADGNKLELNSIIRPQFVINGNRIVKARDQFWYES